jgi:hypothetical protein
MAEEPPSRPVRGRWLPPRAPGAAPPPRFEAGGWAPPQPARSAPPATPDPGVPAVARGELPASTNGLAVISLVLGLIGLALVLMSLGYLFFLSLPFSIAGWACGRAAKRRAERGLTRGQGAAQAGLWLGLIGLGLGVAAMIVWIALLSSGFSLEDLRRDLERELEQRRRSGG